MFWISLQNRLRLALQQLTKFLHHLYDIGFSEIERIMKHPTFRSNYAIVQDDLHEELEYLWDMLTR